MARASQQVSLVDHNGQHQRSISKTEAKKLCSTGDRVAICRQCGKHGESLKAKQFCGAHGKQHYIVYMLTEQGKHNIHRSNTSISFSEVLANVGLSRRDERDHPISQAYERMVRDKITAWPLCHDTKAPMVVPRT
jgi:hypothetical protein